VSARSHVENAGLEIAFACPARACGKPVEGRLGPHVRELTCGACGQATPLPESPTTPTDAAPSVCCVCGAPDLYGQRDFNRTLGLTLAAIGLALGPLTGWISTIVAVAIDAVLYLLMPTVAVCYACNAQYRGFARPRAPKAFEIAIHDAYKFGKRFPPRRAVAVAGPLAKRLELEGKTPPGPFT
jgi:hypothetical protein